MVNVCIVGLGLIGGSLGQALRRVRRRGKRVYSVSGWGRSSQKCKLAKRLKAVDQWSLNPTAVLSNADIVVLCTPVQTIAKLGKKIIPFMKSGALLTDVGSVKGPLQKEIGFLLKKRKDISFVGAHPIAGSEKAGVRFAQPHLFRGANCVIIKEGTKKDDVKKIERLWGSVGCRCTVMSAQQHDEILALTSHLPHLISFALYKLALRKGKKNPRVFELMGDSFRELTRIAGSDPTIWDGIFSTNQKWVRHSTQAFLREISFLSNKMKKNMVPLLGTISHAKNTRN